MNLVNPVVRMRRKNNLKPCETIRNYCATGEVPCNVCFVIPESQDVFSPSFSIVQTDILYSYWKPRRLIQFMQHFNIKLK